MSSSGPLFAFLSSCTWAVGSVGYSRLAQTHSAFAVNFARALVALPLFLIAVFVTSGGWEGSVQAFGELRASHFGWFSLAMFASYGFGDVLFLWSTRHLGVPGALAIASSYPLWAALVGHFFYDQNLTSLRVLGLFVTITGVVVVILSGARERGGARGKVLRGVLLAFATSLLWATNSFAISQGGKDLSTFVGNTVRMILAMGLSFGIGRMLLPKSPVCLPMQELSRWLWLFALEAFLGSCFFMYGLSHSPLAIGTTLSSLAPVISVPVAWFLGVEKFSASRTFGVCLVVSGIWVLLGGF